MDGCTTGSGPGFFLGVANFTFLPFPLYLALPSPTLFWVIYFQIISIQRYVSLMTESNLIKAAYKENLI